MEEIVLLWSVFCLGFICGVIVLGVILTIKGGSIPHTEPPPQRKGWPNASYLKDDEKSS